MKNFLRIALVLTALGMLLVGLGFAAAVPKVLGNFAIAATSVHGMGTVRADLGGCFVALGLFTLFGLRRGHAQWLTVPLVFMAAFLSLRLIHLGADGVSSEGLRSTVIEVVLLALLLAARTLFRDDVQAQA